MDERELERLVGETLNNFGLEKLPPPRRDPEAPRVTFMDLIRNKPALCPRPRLQYTTTHKHIHAPGRSNSTAVTNLLATSTSGSAAPSTSTPATSSGDPFGSCHSNPPLPLTAPSRSRTPPPATPRPRPPFHPFFTPPSQRPPAATTIPQAKPKRRPGRLPADTPPKAKPAPKPVGRPKKEPQQRLQRPRQRPLLQPPTTLHPQSIQPPPPPPTLQPHPFLFTTQRHHSANQARSRCHYCNQQNHWRLTCNTLITTHLQQQTAATTQHVYHTMQSATVALQHHHRTLHSIFQQLHQHSPPAQQTNAHFHINYHVTTYLNHLIWWSLVTHNTLPTQAQLQTSLEQRHSQLVHQFYQSMSQPPPAPPQDPQPPQPPDPWAYFVWRLKSVGNWSRCS